MRIGIEHVAVFAKDTKALSDWYKEVFDCKVVYDSGKGTYFIAFEDNSMIEFCTASTENIPSELTAPGLRHIAISVDDFDVLADRVRKTGAQIISEPVVNEKGVGTMFFRDPEGNILHLISRKTPLV